MSKHTVLFTEDIETAARHLREDWPKSKIQHRVSYLRGYLPELEELWAALLEEPVNPGKVELGRTFQAENAVRVLTSDHTQRV